MSGYEADLDAIAAAAGVLRSAADGVASVRLDEQVCARLGTDRLAAAAAGLTGDTRRDLGAVLDTLGGGADLLGSVHRGYAEADEQAAGLVTRRGESGR